MKPLRVGLIGRGRISDIYLENCARFEAIDVVACASLDLAESEAKARQHAIPKTSTPDAIFDDPDID